MHALLRLSSRRNTNSVAPVTIKCADFGVHCIPRNRIAPPHPPSHLRATMWTEVLVTVLAVLTGTFVCIRAWLGFRFRLCESTASMECKTVIITGATAGMGKEAARDLLRRGARVIIASKDNLEQGARVASELRADAGSAGEVVMRHLDTSDLASVRTFAKEVLDSEKAIHVLVNNAGIATPEERQVTADGLEMTMATNYFGHFLLTNLLLGRLKESAPSRVVNVSSIAHKYVSKFDVNDLTFSNKYVQAYHTSKLCNVLFTRELADRLAGTGVTVNSLHPGIVKTDIFNSLSLSFTTLVRKLLLKLFGKDANLGAQTTIHLAVSEEVEGTTGRYFVDCKEEPTSKLARRKDLATGLWEVSVKTVGLKQHEQHC